jgi:sigma-B regulation protein RsbU (phosphoserine phosphatase)
MDEKVFNRIRAGLLEQSQNIEEWIQKTPAEEKQIRLGPLNETAIQEHLDVLHTAASKAEDQTLGICTVCHDYVESSRLEVDYTASVCIDHFTDGQRRKLEKELELSQKVQKALLPQEIPDLPGLELAAFSQPARIVGGDYFDFFQFADGSSGFVIADVMGKGIAASLLMASLQASLRILVTQETSPAEVLKRLNQLFVHNINLTKFVTIFLAQYKRDSNTLHYCNAGHNPALLFSKRTNGKPEGTSFKWLNSTAPAIGLAEVEEFQCDSTALQLSSGDRLLLYTDGVTEAQNASEEEFGVERLSDVASQNPGVSSIDLIAAVKRALREHTKGQPPEDDTTILAVRVL